MKFRKLNIQCRLLYSRPLPVKSLGLGSGPALNEYGIYIAAWNSTPLFWSVLWIRKYFFRIRIHGSVFLNYGSGSRMQINYGSDRVRTLNGNFWDRWKFFFQIRSKSLFNTGITYILTSFLKLLWIVRNRNLKLRIRIQGINSLRNLRNLTHNTAFYHAFLCLTQGAHSQDDSPNLQWQGYE